MSARRARSAPSPVSVPKNSRGSAGWQLLPADSGPASPSGPSLERVQVGDIQRARLLAGAAAAICELGYEHATVGHITARARVSRRTFYDMFAGREECLAAVLDDTVERVERDLSAAGLEGLPWRERTRTGLWRILCFLDREPVLARVCVVEAPRAGALVQQRRELLHARLLAALREGHPKGSRREAPGALTAEGLLGAATAIVHARLSRSSGGAHESPDGQLGSTREPRESSGGQLESTHEPLAGLLGELMGMIVLPYLGPAAARRERQRPAPPQPAVAPKAQAGAARGAGDPLEGLRMRVTYRTMRVLAGVGELARGGQAPSNRQVADYAGIQDPGQVSRLLRRLERLGLLANSGHGHASGERNAWTLTPRGQQLTQNLALHTDAREQAA